MKRVFFVLIITAIASQLKAQQLTFKPADSALLKGLKESPAFRLTDSSLLKGYLNAPDKNTLALLNTLKDQKNTEIFYSTMPVVKMGSRDKMPVVKPGDSNMNYFMPVKKIKVVDPLKKEQPATP